MKADDTVRIAAYLRANVTLRLMAELSPEEVRAACDPPRGAPRPGRRTHALTIQLAVPGGPVARIRVRDGRVEGPKPGRRGGAALATVTLLFPRPAHLVATLTGGRAPVIPVPGSPRFPRAIATFRALSASLQQAFADPERRPRLLLLATLYAVEEVANRDPWVAARVARIPDGTIAVRVAGDAGVGATVRVTADGGRPRLAVEPAGVAASAETVGGAGPVGGARPAAVAPNAVLEFSDRQAAADLLTGATSAALALAEGRVRLRGRLPMIQHLFPVLDRVASYLGGNHDR